MQANCPVCGRALSGQPGDARLAPFCSRHCADIDLGRWFTGQYRIPAEDMEAPEAEVDRSDGNR